MAQVITKRSKLFANKEFVKGFFRRVTSCVPRRQNNLKNKSLFCQPLLVAKYLEISVKESLASNAGDFAFYSLVIVESMNSKDTAQVAILVGDVNESFDVAEGLAAIVPSKRTTKGCDLFKAVMTTLNSLRLNLNNMSGIPTYGAPTSAICRSLQGLVKLLQNEASQTGNNSIMQIHCLIYQENFCAKFLKTDNATSVVTKRVNFMSGKKIYASGNLKIYCATWDQILMIFRTTAK